MEVDGKPSGKIGKTKEEMLATYNSLLHNDDKDDTTQNGFIVKDLSKTEKDSVINVLLNIIRNEGM